MERHHIYLAAALRLLSQELPRLYGLEPRTQDTLKEDMVEELSLALNDAASELFGVGPKDPHLAIGMVRCSHCGHEWTAIRPRLTKLYRLECPTCNKLGSSLIPWPWEIPS